MLSRNKDNKSKSSNSSNALNSINSIVQGTTIEGQISSDTDIRIDGIIVGDLNCKAKVIIGQSGSVQGDIKCTNATVEGKFKGTIQVKDLLNVRETAIIEGDVMTGKLIVQSGAIFNVSCKMGAENTVSLGKTTKLIASK